jgi:hypothetical protein
MKSIAVVTLACMLATASAFTAPTMATRAVGNPFARNKAKTEPVAVSLSTRIYAAMILFAFRLFVVNSFSHVQMDESVFGKRDQDLCVDLLVLSSVC